MKLRNIKHALRWPRWLVWACGVVFILVVVIAMAGRFSARRVGGPGRFLWHPFARQVVWPIPEDCRKAAARSQYPGLVSVIRDCRIEITDGHGQVYRKRDDSIALVRKDRCGVFVPRRPSDENMYYLVLFFSGRQISDIVPLGDGFWKAAPVSKDGRLFDAETMYPERIRVTIGDKDYCQWRRGEDPPQ